MFQSVLRPVFVFCVGLSFGDIYSESSPVDPAGPIGEAGREIDSGNGTASLLVERLHPDLILAVCRHH